MSPALCVSFGSFGVVPCRSHSVLVLLYPPVGVNRPLGRLVDCTVRRTPRSIVALPRTRKFDSLLPVDPVTTAPCSSSHDRQPCNPLGLLFICSMLRNPADSHILDRGAPVCCRLLHVVRNRLRFKHSSLFTEHPSFTLSHAKRLDYSSALVIRIDCRVTLGATEQGEGLECP
jgi:hypothetical protein